MVLAHFFHELYRGRGKIRLFSNLWDHHFFQYQMMSIKYFWHYFLFFFHFWAVAALKCYKRPCFSQKIQKKSQNFEYAYLTYHWTGNFTLFSILFNKRTQIRPKKSYYLCQLFCVRTMLHYWFKRLIQT